MITINLNKPTGINGFFVKIQAMLEFLAMEYFKTEEEAANK